MPTDAVTTLRIAMAQVNPVVGDIEGNAALIKEAVAESLKSEVDVVLFPEMVLTGYPVEDLALRPAFRKASIDRVQLLAKEINEIGAGDVLVVVGYLDEKDKPHNAVALIHGGEIKAKYIKHHLPNYGVFDEFRNFGQGKGTLVARYRGVDIAVVICEDIWQDQGPVAELAKRTPGIVLVPNGSPYERNKDDVRLALVQRRVVQIGAPMIYVNMTGAQDDLVFDGDSLAVGIDQKLLARSVQFKSSLDVVDVPVVMNSSQPDVLISDAAPLNKTANISEIAPRLSDEEEVWSALVMGLGDYVRKNGFKSVALGLSGGIDSALVATLAVDAVGKENVYGVSLPSKYSSAHSLSDAKELATNLGIDYRVIEIEPVVQSFVAATKLTGVAEENVQARVRGSLLMGLSNQEGHLILATGNKSELAVGYSTLYGDAVGGFAPIKDIFKVDVWRLAKWRNEAAKSRGEVAPIPENSITKEPSAELRPGQKDTDSLPDYQLLDRLLDIYVEKNGDAAEIIKAGFEKSLVDRVITMVDRAEYKRRQYPPGTKVSAIAFGKDRRLPMTSRWKER
ncbi:MAG TPA: NAD+ synthase [Candidatus Nanopelagicaceae bacterium]|nr:NAD+ synthase [Candidatus Nanopelagicaceae bacterium]